MLAKLSMLPRNLLKLARNQKGQDTFEYLLIIGGVTVAVITAISLAAPGLIGAVITGTCDAIATLNVPVDCGGVVTS